MLLVRISLRAFFTSDCEKVELSDTQLSSLNKPPSQLKIHVPSIKLSKLM